MTTLARLQEEFFAAILDERAPAASGHAVYHRNVFANWHGALASTYPVVRRLVGEAFFREAARRFGIEHPSASGDLHRYGASFPDFLGAYSFARSLPYLPDVARLEWACHESFHAADAPRFDATRLAAVPPERHGTLRFAVHPSARFVRSDFPVASIWEANQPDRDGTPERSAGGEQVLVRREALDVRLRRLDAGQWIFLQALARGEPLEHAVDAIDDDASFVPAFLATLAADGTLSGLGGLEGGA
jgi:hypothetical protein